MNFDKPKTKGSKQNVNTHAFFHSIERSKFNFSTNHIEELNSDDESEIEEVNQEDDEAMRNLPNKRGNVFMTFHQAKHNATINVSDVKKTPAIRNLKTETFHRRISPKRDKNKACSPVSFIRLKSLSNESDYKLNTVEKNKSSPKKIRIFSEEKVDKTQVFQTRLNTHIVYILPQQESNIACIKQV